MTRNPTVVIVMTAAAVALLAAPIAATAGSITADPAEADADSTHTVRAAVGPDLDDSSLSGLDVDYQATDRNGDVRDVAVVYPARRQLPSVAPLSGRQPEARTCYHGKRTFRPDRKSVV